jgi:hypothetical protein
VTRAKKAGGDEPQKQVYAMPAVEAGDSVWWHDGDESPPTGMALVTFVGTDTITLAVLGEGYQNFIVKTGVRHKGHPNKELIRQTGEGVWTHRPGHLQTQDRLLKLECRLQDLLNELGKPCDPVPGRVEANL